MNVRELKILLEHADDDALVVIPGSDHSYNEGHGSFEDIELVLNKRGKVIHMAEYYDRRNMYDQKELAERGERSQVVEALVITAG